MSVIYRLQLQKAHFFTEGDLVNFRHEDRTKSEQTQLRPQHLVGETM